MPLPRKKIGFCIYSPEEKILRMKFVEDRSENSLLHLIVEWVEEGVEIWSDKWKVYHSIKDGIKFMEEIKDENGKYSGKMVEKIYHYTHKMVNHSDPDHPYKSIDGICTNAVEEIWCVVKRTFKQYNGIPQKFLQSHLDEYLYRFNLTNGEPNDVFMKLLTGISNNWPAKWN